MTSFQVRIRGKSLIPRRCARPKTGSLCPCVLASGLIRIRVKSSNLGFWGTENPTDAVEKLYYKNKALRLAIKGYQNQMFLVQQSQIGRIFSAVKYIHDINTLFWSYYFLHVSWSDPSLSRGQSTKRKKLYVKNLVIWHIVPYRSLNGVLPTTKESWIFLVIPWLSLLPK